MEANFFGVLLKAIERFFGGGQPGLKEMANESGGIRKNEEGEEEYDYRFLITKQKEITKRIGTDEEQPDDKKILNQIETLLAVENYSQESFELYSDSVTTARKAKKVKEEGEWKPW